MTFNVLEALLIVFIFEVIRAPARERMTEDLRSGMRK